MNADDRHRAAAYHADRVSGLTGAEARAALEGLVTTDPSFRTPWDDAPSLEDALGQIEQVIRASPAYDAATDRVSPVSPPRRLI